jgi:CheY-like chemotaxis protein
LVGGFQCRRHGYAKNEARQIKALFATEPVLPEVLEAAPADPTEKLSTNDALPTLLIIEDNPDVVYYIKSLLADQYAIETAENGSQGIQKAIASFPDIIISDVMMPEKDGFEVVETLKRDERTCHIPIILLTAKATREDRLAGLQHAADGCAEIIGFTPPPTKTNTAPPPILPRLSPLS